MSNTEKLGVQLGTKVQLVPKYPWLVGGVVRVLGSADQKYVPVSHVEYYQKVVGLDPQDLQGDWVAFVYEDRDYDESETNGVQYLPITIFFRCARSYNLIRAAFRNVFVGG